MRFVPVVAAVVCVLTMGAAREPGVDYVVRPVIGAGGLEALAVEMRFTGEKDGSTRVSLPTRWAGEKELWKNLSDITVEGGTMTEQEPGLKVIAHRPGARITMRYRVKAGYPRGPVAADSYKPVVQPTWFHILGETAFAEPEDQESRSAIFAWKDWPKDWTIASDLDHGRMGRRMTVGDVRESVSLGGTDVRVLARPIAGGVARIAVRGKWSFPDEELADTLASILDSQRRFWNDVREPYFVSLVPTEELGGTSVGGTGRTDGFAMFATPNAEIEGLRYLIAHEHLHSWLPRRVGRMPRQQEPLSYWFSEGFTDFYTYRTLLRTGTWSLEDFTLYANESIGMYDMSSVRTEPNARIGKDFWNDYEVEKLPYQRGMLMAFYWDDRVRKATDGARDLDDVLFLMRDRRRAAKAREEVDYVRDGFVRAMKDVAGLDITDDLARHIDAGEPVTLPDELFGSCARIVVERRAVFERGWDPEATGAAGNVVTGLKDDSPAYAAGLRNGMKIVKRSAGKVGDSRVEYALLVKDGETERTIRFMPLGKTSYTAREIVLAPGMDEPTRKACAARMGGV